MATIEPQAAAIKKLMAARKRAWVSDGRTASDYPKWKPGMTTETYIRLYAIGKNVLPFGPRKLDPRLGFVEDLSHLARPAPFYDGHEVVEEDAAALEVSNC